MANQPICLSCGQPLAGDARQGFCPRCLFLQAGAGTVGPGAGARDGPSHEEGSPEVAPSSSASLLPRSFGDYELLEEIGRGGMGVVYRARQRSLNRVVAIKLMVFGPGSSPGLVKRFRAEAVSAASLHHPNIVTIYEVGVHEGQHFFVMDYVEGQSLARLIGHQALSAKRAAGYLKTVAEAVHYAHERGILHRDLKPSNVLIDLEDQPRVVDFGLAKRLDDSQLSTLNSQLTFTGQVLGSPHYLPPEQAAGQRAGVSRRTDVYALGATLYHLVTGRPPFEAESLALTLDLVRHADPVPPRLLNPGLPRDLETICLKSLEKEPSRRYATAQELADELARFHAGEPIRARPLGVAGKAWRWCRRKPELAGLTAVAVLALLLGFTGVLWQWREAVRQRQRAAASEVALQRRTYVAEINSAQQALKARNPGRALELLNRYWPEGKSGVRSSKEGAVGIDLRGFEWRYLWQQCQSQGELVAKLPTQIRSLEISADGQWLFGGSQGGEPKLWNLATGEQVRIADDAGWSYGTFSPDSRLLAFCAETPESYGRILIWDLEARKHLEPICDSRPVGAPVFSPDGRWLGFGAHQPPWDRALPILEFRTRQRMHELHSRTPMAGLDFGFDLLFTPDSRNVIATETDAGDILMSEFAGRSEPQHFTAHREPISAMAISPDGQTLATGAGYTETVIKLWQVPSFRLVRELTGHQGWITALRFSPDGRSLASSGADRTWRLWDVPTWKPLRVFTDVSSDVLRLRFSPDGANVFTGSRDGTIQRWSLAAKPSQPQPSSWRPAVDLEGVVSALGANQFAGLRRGSVYVGEVQSETPPTELTELGTNNTCLLFSSDGLTLCAGTLSGEVQVWSMSRRQVVHAVRRTTEPVILMCQDPQGRVLVVGQQSTNFIAGRPYPDTRINFWDTAEWRAHSIPPPIGIGVAWTDGKWLAGNWRRRAIQVWSLSDPARTNRLSFPGEPVAGAFSPDGRLLAAANEAGTLKVWEIPGFRQFKELQAHAYPISALTFSPDSRRLITAAEGDKLIKLWDVETWQELISLPRERGRIQELIFTGGGNQVAARTSAGEILFWRAPSFAEIAQRVNQQSKRK